jgi:hypothetical protein
MSLAWNYLLFLLIISYFIYCSRGSSVESGYIKIQNGCIAGSTIDLNNAYCLAVDTCYQFLESPFSFSVTMPSPNLIREMVYEVQNCTGPVDVETIKFYPGVCSENQIIVYYSNIPQNCFSPKQEDFLKIFSRRKSTTLGWYAALSVILVALMATIVLYVLQNREKVWKYLFSTNIEASAISYQQLSNTNNYFSI